MATSKFKLNYKGGREVLNEMSVAAVNALGRQIAGEAGDDAEFEPYTTDRAAAAVSVPADQQAKDGLLSRAASASGLEVRLK
jgi:hypothetical protein